MLLTFSDLLCEPEGDCRIDRLLDIAVDKDEDGLGVPESEEMEALCVEENVGEDEGNELWEIVPLSVVETEMEELSEDEEDFLIVLASSEGDELIEPDTVSLKLGVSVEGGLGRIDVDKVELPVGEEEELLVVVWDKSSL